MLLLFSGTLSPVLGSNSVNIFPPESKPYGLTFAEHDKKLLEMDIREYQRRKVLLTILQEKNVRTGQSNTNSSVFYLSM